MYAAAARDTASVFLLDGILSIAREEFIERCLRREVPEPDFFANREQEAVSIVKRRFFTDEIRNAVRPTDGSMSDDEDFDSHGQKLMEQAIWFTHEHLKEIPFVGQEGSGDD